MTDDSLNGFLEMEKLCLDQDIDKHSVKSTCKSIVIPKICVNDTTVSAVTKSTFNDNQKTMHNDSVLNETMMILSDSDSDDSDKEFNDTIERFDYIVQRANRNQLVNKTYGDNFSIVPIVSENRIKLLQEYGSGNGEWSN